MKEGEKKTNHGQASEQPHKVVLSVSGLTKEYVNGPVHTKVLHGFCLSLHAGEIAALIGPSGSGKSTLLNIMGLLDRQTSGNLSIDGTEIHRLSDQELTGFRGSKLGFIFQFHHLLPAFTAVENVMIPLMAKRGYFEPWMRDRAQELLARVGLSDKFGSRPSELSGGQQQRVAIARALATNPVLVLADEPTGNLDSDSSDEVFALLREVSREKGTSLLVVTHDPRIAERCDRIVEIVDGRIVSDSTGNGKKCGQCSMPCPYFEHKMH